MAHQSPMISIPKKGTDEVDWTTPIRNLIAQSYGESPDNYAAECAALQRCRQDAVRGAGSDITARDLLYKYFGQLELLELRFSEIRVNFPWRDAFTNKLITQTSIAYEKASILFQIAATHSSIAISQSRSDPEGVKRAFYYLRTCAGMLNYINENFLHAPSTDLSRDVVKFLVNIILAQATEVFFEKCVDEKKGGALVSKVASQGASMYASLNEEVKEFMGKGIFDRNWVSLLQIKAKYFGSLAQYHRALADDAAGKHGDALVRFIQSETLAKEANRLATSFASMFVSTMSPTLPPDAGTSIQDRTKAHMVICTDKKNDAQRENDLIYNAVLTAPEALPAIDKVAVATPIHIHDVYGAPEVQKTIGQDIFIRLVPLSVHESASVYSEEKAKLVRGEVERADATEGEARSAIDGLGIKESLVRFKAMAEGEVEGSEEVPVEVRRWKEDISVIEEREGVDSLMAQLNNLKANVQRELEGVTRDLDIETRDCETMRVKYEHLWSQAPSATLTKTLRADLKSHYAALEAAGASDQQVVNLWTAVRSDINLIRSPQLEDLFRAEAGSSTNNNLLDLDVGNEADDARERVKIGSYVGQVESALKRLNLISRERSEVIRDLKDKIQNDDVSHLLLLNRRNTGVEPAIFAKELEKFKPYQQRLTATIHHQEVAIQELNGLWKSLKDLAGRGPGARKWEEREKRKKDTVKRFSRARDVYMEVRDGLAKGLQFYTELTGLTVKLRENARAYISDRKAERDALVAKLELEKKLSAPSHAPPPLAAKPPLPPPPSKSGLDASFASLSLGDAPPAQSQPWQGAGSPYAQQYGQQQQQPSPPAQSPGTGQYSPSPYQYNNQPGPPPPPPPSHQHQYSGSFNSLPPPPPPPQQHQQQPQQQPQRQSSYLPPPPPRPVTQSSYTPSAPASDPYASLAMFNATPSAPPPPPPGGGASGAYASSPPPPPPPQQQQYYYAPPPPPLGQGGYQGYGQQQHQSPAPPPPPPPQQGQQQQQYGAFPPPPPPQQQQQYGYQQQQPYGYGGPQYGQRN
ncbi:BRO1-domain-containing protein [Ephemerocybe angulata]|uniref:BRO domain-containing protein 1 n=1 Tax=Ephemerocybe angulata TaxID=980116 RepID=A0A8H6HSW1_9AGAR|nr:BRO1-domain-containing protein [Tulosesus angulatus]